ncbi:MAG TPA: SsrA-binding protein SmpB [Candidatus Polarisedimenticolia bacterium]|jgi:SsrA-binding protein|nr:SsrA-binding protein SmpB [Candidatus Polarisedimenticolia bacterium]
MADKEDVKVLSTNRQAFHEYFIEDKVEAGIVLVGTEVKSLRQGRANLKESYALVRHNEIWLLNCHISPYSHGNLNNHDPLRERKLLLHREEIRRLDRRRKHATLTLVPLRLYLRKGKVKVELALARGKKLYDKREAIKRRDLDRESRRE